MIIFPNQARSSTRVFFLHNTLFVPLVATIFTRYLHFHVVLELFCRIVTAIQSALKSCEYTFSVKVLSCCFCHWCTLYYWYKLLWVSRPISHRRSRLERDRDPFRQRSRGCRLRSLVRLHLVLGQSSRRGRSHAAVASGTLVSSEDRFLVRPFGISALGTGVVVFSRHLSSVSSLPSAVHPRLLHVLSP